MRRRYRAPGVVALALLVALGLSSCTPATFVWGYVGDGNDLRLAFCHSSNASMMRLSVFERTASGLVEVESAVWSGPRIAVPVGGIVASGDLPEGWQKTNGLDLGGRGIESRSSSTTARRMWISPRWITGMSPAICGR